MIFTIPERCGKCKKKKKGEWFVLDPPKVKKKGKTLVIPYTRMAYLCKDCQGFEGKDFIT